MSKIRARSQKELNDIYKWYVEEGKSASEIAALIGNGETRNMVIGVVNRRGWNRSTAAQLATIRAVNREKARTRPRPTPAVSAAPPPPAPADPNRVEPSLPRPIDRTGPNLFELLPYQCRNPVGPDPRLGKPQMFCGEPVTTRTVETSKGVFQEKVDSYCAPCAARNRQALVPARRVARWVDRSVRGYA